MTGQLSAGVQRRPFATVGGHPSGPIRQASQSNISSAAPRPSKAFLDLAESEEGGIDGEHPPKRQKLDTNVKPAPSVVGTPRLALPQSTSETLELKKLWERGRPAWSFPGQSGVAPSGVVAKEDGKAGDSGNPTSPLPLPSRPSGQGRPVDRHDKARTLDRKSTPNREVQTAPYRLGVPETAPSINEDKHADFFPWTGNHPEDILNEQTAKTGYYDRVQVSQNETNTARPSLYTVFKNRGGLQTLSGLLLSALEQRQLHQKIHSGSTFKPPPRVTLTEAKRKAWLSDLANPNASLRRLSRTIPQGVRGQMLLEQCLSHVIPIGRAVWFAKCVGANEIRTLKRKGTSGSFAAAAEVKWVRDWTTNVEQFVESVLAGCGEAGWKDQITYTLRFAARLYYDNLLDQEHYLDWIVSSLSATNLDRLPIWLSIMRIHWPDLVRYRKTGKSLAESLLQKLDDASHAEPEMLPISKRLSHIIKGFAHLRPTCFLLPRSWTRYESVLESCLDLSDDNDLKILEILARKNAWIAGRDSQKTKGDRPSMRQTIIHLLDAANEPYSITHLSTACLDASKDHLELIRIVLEWSSSHFRAGEARLYLALRLLRRWQKSGIDIQPAISQVLATSEQSRALDIEALRHITSELVRSQTFSLGRYMQALMARGILHLRDNVNNPEIRLLREVPLYALPAHVQNLRNTILNRVGFSTIAEAQTISRIKSWLQSEAPDVFGLSEDDQIAYSGSMPGLRNLGWTIKSEVSHWVRRSVVKHYHSPRSDNVSKNLPEAKVISTLSLDDFQFIRDVLEQVGDISMLADVVLITCKTKDPSILIAAIDTMNYHFEAFSAIGAMQDLLRAAHDTYISAKASNAPSRQLIVGLLDVSLRLPESFSVMRDLQQDLARDERTNTAAFSPLSDSMADSIQYTGVASADDLDQLIPIGTNVDEQTLNRLFTSLIERLESDDPSCKQSPSTVAQLLWRLKVSKAKQFDALMLKWIERTLQSYQRPPLAQLWAPLIGAGCISLPTVVMVTRRMLASDSAKTPITDPADTTLELLRLICPKNNSRPYALDSVAYRFRSAQQLFLMSHPSDVLGIFKETIAELSNIPNGKEVLEDSSVSEAFRRCIVGHMEVAQTVLVDPLFNSASAKSKDLVSFFDQAFHLKMAGAQDLILLTNDLSLQFCQLRMKLLLNDTFQAPNAANDLAVQSEAIDALFDMAKSNGDSSSSHWVSLVSTLGTDTALRLREKAEEQLLSVITLPSPPTGHEPVSPMASVYLKIIEALSYAIPATGVASMSSILAERMTSLLRHVATMQIVAEQRAVESAAAHLNFLLRLTSIHHNAFSSARSGPKDQARLLIAATSLALNHIFTSFPAIVSNALDVCAALVDDLAEDARLQCVRFLREKTRDPRVCFLFGFGLDRDTLLKVESKGKGVVPFPIRSWEMLEDATPKVGVNDTSLPLGMFQARKAYVR